MVHLRRFSSNFTIFNGINPFPHSLNSQSKKVTRLNTRYIGYCMALLFGAMTGIQCAKNDKSTRFKLRTPDKTGVQFVNNIPDETADGMNIIQYLYYYNGGGVATGDLNNDGLTDVFFTSNLEANQLYLNKGNLQFDNVSARAGIEGTKGTWNTGVTLADVNADGWLDIYVCRVGNYKRWKGKNQLFINQKDGTFTDKAAEYGLDISAFSTQANFIDVDNDGDLDCFLLCHSVHSAGSYRDTAQTRKTDPLAADRLFLCNTTDGRTTYTDVSEAYGIYGGTAGYGLGTVAGDFNGDHFTDIYVANDFHENDYLYINQAGKGFKESVADFTGHTSNFSMGCDLADYNNDALPDLISLDMKPEDEFTLKASQPADLFEIHNFKHNMGYHWQYPRNALQINQTPSPDQVVATEIAYFAGVAATDWSWSALFTDLDLDGWKDLYITNGIVRRPNDMDYIRFTSSDDIQRNATDRQLLEKMPDGAAPNYCFRNTGLLNFNDVSEAWGLNQKGYSNGAAYADLDNDGDVDLVTNNINSPASILENTTRHAEPNSGSSAGRPGYLTVQLKGKGANTHAIGTKLWAYSKDTVQYFENQPVRGFQSCVEPGKIYIGCGYGTGVDSITVRWPDGTGKTIPGGINRVLTLEQNDTIAQEIPAYDYPTVELLQTFTTDFPETNDTRRGFPEKLQPWSLEAGPKPAMNNALLFLPGSEGGTVYRWATNGTAEAIQKLPFAGKGTCAAFFDANGDKLDDLYVGTAPSPTNPNGNDYLFLNNKGRFEPAPDGFLPVSPLNTACVTVADMDNDGDLDVFAGARSEPGAYGVAPRSYLLENDGKGQFRDVTNTKAPKLDYLGLITDAHWADMNKDGNPDLVLCGEWMPIHIFYNSKGTLMGMAIPESNGLWNTVAVDDFDGDGDLDIVGGNFGTNSILTASTSAPLELWVKDFDQNQQVDPVMAYYRHGKKYPFADKDLLISQMPVLKKRYNSYRTYAGDTFDKVFTPDMQKDARVLKVERLETSFFEQKNQGLWTISALSDPIQWAPVHAVAADNLDDAPGKDIWLGGNTGQISPAIGRLDALPLTQASFVGEGQFVPILTDFAIRGLVRAVLLRKDGSAVISTEEGRVYIVKKSVN